MKNLAVTILAWAGMMVCLSLASRATAGGSIPAATLKDAFKHDFLVGVAVNQRQFTGADTTGAALIQRQFNSISPENVLKWQAIHPRPGAGGYNFAPGDRYVEFGETNGMYIVGHTLIWHSQTPQWVFRAADGTNFCDRETLLKRMHDHIQTVVGRYRGRIKCWDVVNEALQDNGELRPSPWLKIIGDDYIAKAFQYAHEADPDAVLRYNDYSLEDEPKRKGAIALIKKLQAGGVPVTAVGLQDHVKLDWPTVEQEDATISDFAKLGVKVMITELDVDLLGRSRSADIAEVQKQGVSNINTNGLPEAVQQALAKRYADLFSVFVKHRNDIALVTFWGVTDGDSWLNRGRQNQPLLFDRHWQPKPAFDAVIQTAQP